MKLKILTLHRADNYGAALQSFSLLNYLSINHSVQFLDYWPNYLSSRYSIRKDWITRSKSSHAESLKILLKTVILIPFRFIKKTKFYFFRYRFLKISPTQKYESKISFSESVLIIGSDQVWRTFSKEKIDYMYFGITDHEFRKIISYAASMGSLEPSVLQKVQEERLLQNFSYLGVREVDLKDYIRDDIGLNAYLTVDPVFLFDKAFWTEFSKKPINTYPSKYILNYNLTLSSETEEIVSHISKKMFLSKMSLAGDVSVRGIYKKNFCQCSGPIDFLRLISGSEFVVTSSFHGVAFSIIYEKQFICTGLADHSNRVRSLLSQLDLEERFVNSVSDLDSLKEIDYLAVRIKLEKIVAKSKLFLEMALNET